MTEQPENESLVVTSSPSPFHRFVWDKQGKRLDIPEGRDCLKPSDAAVTKTLKSLGPTWTATRKKGRKIFSAYRNGNEVDKVTSPLARALRK